MAFDAYIRFCKPEILGSAKIADKYDLKSVSKGDWTGKDNWIQMDEYSFGTSMAVTAARSGGTGAATTGKGKLEPFTFKKNVDKTSLNLAFHAAAGTVFSQIVAKLFVSSSEGGASQVGIQFLTIIMSTAVINSCKLSGGGGDDLPTEDISINFGEIEYIYSPFQVKDGVVTTTGQKRPFWWSTVTNKGGKTEKP